MGKKDERPLTDAELELIREARVRKIAMDQIYQEWLDAIYDGEEPAHDPGRPYREAVRIANTEDPDIENPELLEMLKVSRILARTLLLAVEKSQEALDALKAEVAYSHPEALEELNRRLRELRGEGGAQENPEPGL